MANLSLTQEKLEALRSEYKHRRGKYPRQKMLPEYQSIYPWVLPDETDPYCAFCTVCECRLSAKRSDLGKHEGSIKHTENAAKKGLGHTAFSDGSGLVLKGSHTMQQVKQEVGEGAICDSAEAASEDDDDEDISEGIYIKQEPVVDLVENSNNALNLDDINQQNGDNSQSQNSEVEDDEEDDDDEEGDDYDDDDDDENYVPPNKRRTSETDSQSQHSSTLDYLPVQVTIGDANTGQRFSIREISPAGPYPTPSSISSTAPAAQQYASQNTPAFNNAQTPCKITIKKITTPITPATPTQVTSTATIMPLGMAPQPGKPLQPTVPTPAASTNASFLSAQHIPAPLQAIAVPPRDSFDLFFESICASVKALPPKLATEGKIRVMQLIGELEMRAITERELEQSKATGQQNSTVASTTK